MCGFLVCPKVDVPKDIIEKEFEKIKHRGPNMTKIIIKEESFIGFHRLAIMGVDEKGMQPFKRDNKILVCNGEIYGFKKEKNKLLSKGYNFQSDSDCEILIPMYEEYGSRMFKKLDAEFALVMYDFKSKKLIAARDPIGIRPLFYGYLKGNGSIIFASEVKSIERLCSEVYAFPPGTYYEDGKFIKYYDATICHKEHPRDSYKTIYKKINKYLTEGVKKRLESDVPIGFLLSGGLDSSLVCSIAARNTNEKIRTFAIGMDKDAIDLKYAKQVAEYIGSIHTEVIITKDDIKRALRDVIYQLETWDITTIRASIGMYLLCKWIRNNTDIKVLLTGEISDELFGYKYTDFAPSALEFQKESEKRVRELYMYDVLRADRCISGVSLEARVPFGDLKFVDYVMGIDPNKKINKYNMGKYLLRKAFTGRYLPDSILYREKAAFSDAVGHSLVDDLKEMAENLYSDEEYQKRTKKYLTHRPFTKESLMYREIFEEFYSGRSDLIVDYWMPNKNWEGCNVSDPSARVLSNYGASGK